MRHGQTTHNRDRLASGHVDPELTEAGAAQAEAVRQKLSHVHFDEVYSSDLKRAADTAAIVYGSSIIPIHLSTSSLERSELSPLFHYMKFNKNH